MTLMESGTNILYENGTGRFENVSGKVKLYQTMEMIDDLKGVFSNYGEGWIKY